MPLNAPCDNFQYRSSTKPSPTPVTPPHLSPSPRPNKRTSHSIVCFHCHAIKNVTSITIGLVQVIFNTVSSLILT